MTPKSEALAYRIWSYANPIGWNATISEVASALGVTPQSAAAVCQHKGWVIRLRVQKENLEKHRHIDPMQSLLGGDILDDIGMIGMTDDEP